MTTNKRIAESFPALKNLGFTGKHKSVPFVQQLEWTDCGAASLCMVMAFHGRETKLEQLAQLTHDIVRGPAVGVARQQAEIRIVLFHGIHDVKHTLLGADDGSQFRQNESTHRQQGGHQEERCLDRGVWKRGLS